MTNRLANRLRSALCSAFCASLAACAAGTPPAPAPGVVVVVDTVEIREPPDPELERHAATLQLQLWERSRQVDDLQRQVDAARQEVVRVMSRLQTLASRAEAASAMAEAEIGVQAMSETAGDSEVPAAAEARYLLVLSAAEFAAENYGGALYLASQARNLARAGEIRLVNEDLEDQRAGEVSFALTVPLTATRRSNVRSGPGLQFRVRFLVEPGTSVVGHSHTEEWVRVTDDQGREGWIFHSLLVGPEVASR